MVKVVLLERIDQLQTFLERKRRNRLVCLLKVPWTARIGVPKPRHESL